MFCDKEFFEKISPTSGMVLLGDGKLPFPFKVLGRFIVVLVHMS
jgi:hypothetical protein